LPEINGSAGLQISPDKDAAGSKLELGFRLADAE
jgi:hypothetical protein